jgi:hypothetical protein
MKNIRSWKKLDRALTIKSYKKTIAKQYLWNKLQGRVSVSPDGKSASVATPSKQKQQSNIHNKWVAFLQHINSNNLYENCNNGTDAIRKNLSYTLFIIIITLDVLEIIAIFSYFYFRKKYHIHVYD